MIGSHSKALALVQFLATVVMFASSYLLVNDHSTTSVFVRVALVLSVIGSACVAWTLAMCRRALHEQETVVPAAKPLGQQSLWEEEKCCNPSCFGEGEIATEHYHRRVE